MSQPPLQPTPEPSGHSSTAAPAQGPADAGWPPPPSWAPTWTAPGVPAAPAAAAPGPAGGTAQVPSARTGRGLLAGTAVAGLLAGLLGSGLVVAALFAAGADDLGDRIADRIGTAVEEGLVEGTRVAMEESMDAAMEGMPEDMAFPGSTVPADEQFPPVPPPPDLGPDPVLDDYAQQCFDGELQACDDLMYESPPLSAYEEYATTCGGRVKPYVVMACTDLE